MSDDTLIPLGEIVTTHGLRGEVRVRAFNPDTKSLAAGATVQLRRDGKITPRRISASRRHRQMFLLTFDGIASIELAQPLLGSEICLPVEELPDAGPDSFYHFELVGMQVVTVGGEEIGKVVEVMDTAGSDICIVRGPGTEHLIPLVADVVTEIDRQGRRIVIDPIPGLLDP